MFDIAKCSREVAELFASVDSLIAASRVASPWALPTTEPGETEMPAAEKRLLWDLRAVITLQRRLAVETGRMLNRAQAQDAFLLDGWKSMTGWVNGEMLMPAADALALSRLARSIEELPAVGKLVEEGTLSAAHMRATANATAGMPAERKTEADEFLAEHCAQKTAREFKIVSQELRETIVPELVEEELEGLKLAEHVTVGRVAGGIKLKAFFAGLAAEQVFAALERFSVKLADDYRDAGKRRADGMALALSIAANADLTARDLEGSGYQPSDLPRVNTQIVADVITMRRALERQAEEHAALADAAWERIGLPTWLPSSLDELVRGARGERTDAPISGRELLAAMCDGAAQRLIMEARSEVLDLGRSARLFSKAQRRALLKGKGTCCWPGCDSPWVEADHIEPWIVGGRTDLINGRMLCTFHHSLVHLGWRLYPVEGSVDDELRAQAPDDWEFRLLQMRRRARKRQPQPRVA